jgi:hypothetical protein
MKSSAVGSTSGPPITPNGAMTKSDHSRVRTGSPGSENLLYRYPFLPIPKHSSSSLDVASFSPDSAVSGVGRETSAVDSGETLSA